MRDQHRAPARAGDLRRAGPASLPAPSTRTLLRLAAPSAAFTVLTNGFRVVDQYFSHTISTEAQAAIGASTFVLISFYAVFSLVAAGAAPLAARATGADDPSMRRAVIGTSLAALLVLTVALMIAGGVGAPVIARSLGLEGQTAAECARYLGALAWTILPLSLTPFVDQVFIAMGNARVPLALHAVSLSLNIVLTPLLIHGAELGIVGAALASSASRAATTAVGLWLLARATGLTLADLRFTPELRRVLRIGAPMALGIVTYALVYWVMLETSISPLGPHVNAALGIGFSALEGVAWPVFHGLSLAASSFVGRYLGAGRRDLAYVALRRAFPLSTAAGLAATLIFWLGGGALTGLFTDDPLVHRAATEYALVLAASQLFVAWEALAEGVLAGAGDTRAVFWWSAPLNAVRVPLAWLLALPLGWGAAGVWWAINATTYAKVAGKVWALYRGRWARLEP